MTFCAVVIWSDLLGDLQYSQDTLSWHPPNISDCSAGEDTLSWRRERGSQNQKPMLPTLLPEPALISAYQKQYEVTICTQILFLSKQVPTLVAGRETIKVHGNYTLLR